MKQIRIRFVIAVALSLVVTAALLYEKIRWPLDPSMLSWGLCILYGLIPMGIDFALDCLDHLIFVPGKMRSMQIGPFLVETDRMLRWGKEARDARRLKRKNRAPENLSK